MTNAKKAAAIAARRVANAANDNAGPVAIDPADVPVADRRHWLGDISRGHGYTDFEDHPYRLKRRGDLSPYAGVRWRDVVPAKFVEEGAEQHRRWLAIRNAVANDDAPKHLREAAERELAPPYRDRKSASEGLPVDREFVEGRINRDLWSVCQDVAQCYETANAPEVSAMSYGTTDGVGDRLNRRVRAVQVCQTLRYRTMHLWRPLIDAAVWGKTTVDIGRDYGGNRHDAAKLGRQKVIDGLLLAREVFWDLREFERKDSAAIEESEPLAPRMAYALGRRATDIPDAINIAANDNMRAIRIVA